MVLDQPERSLGDRSPDRFDARGDMILRVDRLANIVQQSGQQEFLVVRVGVTRELEDLKAVVECSRLPDGTWDFA